MRVMFVGPSESSQGGISAMIARIRASKLCVENRCQHYPSVLSFESRFLKTISSILLLLAFPFFLAGLRPNVVGIHVSSGPSFIRKFGYFCWAKAFRRKVVIHIHPAHFADYYRAASGMEQAAIAFLARHCDRAIFLTESIAASLTPPFTRARSSVIPNFVHIGDYEKFRRGDDAEQPTLLFLGWIIRDKGVYDIVEAMPAVLEQFPRARFVFAGSKEIDKLRQLLKDRRLEESSAVLGWVAGDDKLRLLAASRLLLLPTYSEGIPSVLLEAMAAGLPALTTPVGGIPEIFIDGVCGKLIQPGDPALLAASIVGMLKDQAALSRMSQATRDHVRTHYSREAVENALQDAYHAAVRN